MMESEIERLESLNKDFLSILNKTPLIEMINELDGFLSSRDFDQVRRNYYYRILSGELGIHESNFLNFPQYIPNTLPQKYVKLFRNAWKNLLEDMKKGEIKKKENLWYIPKRNPPERNLPEGFPIVRNVKELAVAYECEIIAEDINIVPPKIIKDFDISGSKYMKSFLAQLWFSYYQKQKTISNSIIDSQQSLKKNKFYQGEKKYCRRCGRVIPNDSKREICPKCSADDYEMGEYRENYDLGNELFIMENQDNSVVGGEPFFSNPEEEIQKEALMYTDERYIGSRPRDRYDYWQDDETLEIIRQRDLGILKYEPNELLVRAFPVGFVNLANWTESHIRPVTDSGMFMKIQQLRHGDIADRLALARWINKKGYCVDCSQFIEPLRSDEINPETGHSDLIVPATDGGLVNLFYWPIEKPIYLVTESDVKLRPRYLQSDTDAARLGLAYMIREQRLTIYIDGEEIL